MTGTHKYRKWITLSMLVLTLISFVIFFSEDLGLCNSDKIDCYWNVAVYATYFDPVILIFFISLLTYFMRHEVYKAWLIATTIWLPVMFFFTYLVANEGGSLGFGDMYSGLVLVGVYAFYLVLSILTIAIKYFVLWRRERKL